MVPRPDSSNGPDDLSSSTNNIITKEAVSKLADEYKKEVPSAKLKKTKKTIDHDYGFFFGNQTRYVVMVLTTLCFTLAISNSLTLNFTIICMADGEATENGTDSRYNYSATETGWLFSAVAFGNFLGTLPLTYLAHNYGIRSTITVYGIISAISTFATPFAAHTHFYFLLLCRICQGLAVSMIMTGQGTVVNSWSTLARSSLFFTFVSCYLQYGPIFTMPLAGLFCESSFGWQGVYYLHGLLSLIAFGVFFVFFRDSPRFHRNVSTKELAKIEYGKTLSTVSEDGKKPPIPFRAMLTDSAVIGMFLCALGDFLGFQVFMQYGPMYLNKVLGLDVKGTGFAAAIPFIGSIVVKLIVGPLNDYATCIPIRSRVVFFATFSQFAMFACLILLAYLPGNSVLIGQLAYTMNIIFSGLNTIGVIYAAQLLSGQYTHVIMTALAFINSATVLVLPIIVSLVAPNNSPEEWAIIFYFIGGFIVVVTLIFDFTCQVDTRPWAYGTLTRVPTRSVKVFSSNTLNSDAGR